MHEGPQARHCAQCFLLDCLSDQHTSPGWEASISGQVTPTPAGLTHEKVIISLKYASMVRQGPVFLSALSQLLQSGSFLSLREGMRDSKFLSLNTQADRRPPGSYPEFPAKVSFCLPL